MGSREPTETNTSHRTCQRTPGGPTHLGCFIDHDCVEQVCRGGNITAAADGQSSADDSRFLQDFRLDCLEPSQSSEKQTPTAAAFVWFQCYFWEALLFAMERVFQRRQAPHSERSRTAQEALDSHKTNNPREKRALDSLRDIAFEET